MTTPQDFSTLTTQLRPALMRLCSRMMGSLIDGEDVVQDTLVTATAELTSLRDTSAMKSWLFRIAYNRSINALAARARRSTDTFEDDIAVVGDPIDDRLAREQAVSLAIAHFVKLPPAQRACVILKDVLDYALAEIASTLSMSEMAVKAALHRGRSRLAALADAPIAASAAPSALAAKYAQLFNARDWDGVRALLADDVRLDLRSRETRRGAAAVGNYLSNYASVAEKNGLRARVAFLDDHEVLLIEDAAGHERYPLTIATANDRIAEIRDYRYVRALFAEAEYR